MSNRISKRAIKRFIKFYEEKLKELETDGERMQKENNESKYLIYDLTDHYLNEERTRGMIEAAKHILNNF